MDSILAESAALFATPLPQEETQYEDGAKSLISRLSKLTTQELAADKDSLEVRWAWTVPQTDLTWG
jgi:hypothetical protein